ncbi:MAG: hypothetical protein JW749_04075 [Sedimentisphaerales bacterium]|nr:hypothetical protein [Sedimentisphaerales bacterium]
MRNLIYSDGCVERLRLRGSLCQSSNSCVYVPRDVQRNRNERRYRWTLHATIIALCLMTCFAFAVSPSERQQLDNFKVSTLKGLTGVAVTVKIIRDDPATLSLLKEGDLSGEVEYALQKEGIEVRNPTPDVGLYVVLVKVAGGGPDKMELSIDVQSSLRQMVYLMRDSTIKTEAQTWPAVGQSRFGVVSIAIAKSMISRTVKEQAKEFAIDYKAANPKRSTTEETSTSSGQTAEKRIEQK